MKFWKLCILFLILNVSALGIGSWLMGDGAQSQWYLSLNKAPWTPEGWVFGAAWVTVMVCFSFFMAFLVNGCKTTKVIILFLLQFLLNISWNFVFFHEHLIALGLAVITSLALIITALFVTYLNDLKWKSLFILPYLVWIAIATSLNLYIMINN